MTRLRITLVSLAVALSLVSSSAAPAARAAGSGVEPSDVVFVFDFSGSMYVGGTKSKAKATASALDQLAVQIRAIEQKLKQTDLKVHMIHFADDAAPVPGCGTITASTSEGVEIFAKCLEYVADEYRGTEDEWLNLGIDINGGTNYAAAFDAAFAFLKSNKTDRPAVVFFTDGENLPGNKPAAPGWIEDIVESAKSAGVTPRAILPVGLSISKTKAINSLLELYDKGTDLKKCNESGLGQRISWPKVNFPTAKSAADAIAQAFSRVACIDILTPDSPTSATAITDGSSTSVTWGDLPAGSIPADGFEVTCGTETVKVGAGETSATVPTGDANECSVASVAIDETGESVPSNSPRKATVIRPPQPPQKPSVSPGDSSIGAETKPGESADGKPADGGDPISGYKWECIDVATGQPAATAESGGAETSITGVSNGSEYTCSATAVNKAGESKPSEQSDSVKPCNGIFECNPWIAPLLFLALLLALILILLLFIYLWYQRTRGFVTATIDSNRPLALLRGPTTGFSFVSTTVDSAINGARIERSSVQHVAIENKGSDRFKWTDNVSKVSGTVERGGTFQVADPAGGNHQIRLRAYSAQTNDPTAISWSLAAVGNEQADWGGGSSSDSGWGEATSSWEAPATGSQGTSGGWD
jgi:hypothetical protein